MDFKDFLKLDKPTRITLRGGQTQGYVKVEPPKPNPMDRKRTHLGNEYALRYSNKEDKAMELQAQVEKNEDVEGGFSQMSMLDEITSTGTVPNVSELSREELTQVYENYSFERKTAPKLQINDRKDKILQLINGYPVTILTGETGCGKTTQVPQFILDYNVNERKHCNIIVTQPRRIAAISVAKRVCEERGWQVGTLVGYQVGLDKMGCVDTRLLYCTTGVLLQKLVTAKSLGEYTHVILDEVHEREQDMDFVMMVVRKLMRENPNDCKVVLMSATMNCARFRDYFKFYVRGQPSGAPFIELDLKSNFPVQIYYLNHLDSLAPNMEMPPDCAPTIMETTYKLVVKLVKAFDQIDIKENESKGLPSHMKGSVLIFLPGIMEIETQYELLNEEAKKYMQGDNKEYDWWLCPLHSSITAEEQMKVFKPPPMRSRKIILSTNIAESSITVPDIKYVIDFCLTRHLITDRETNLSTLQLAWASRSSLKQRAGRVGRVTVGRVYRLIHQHYYKDYLSEESEPEIQRSPLDRLVLQVKRLDMGEPQAIIALCMDPPDLTNLELTVLQLKQIGGLLGTYKGKRYNSYDGHITFAGEVMAALPLSTQLAKLILLGHVFNVLEECVIMACALSVKSVFSQPFKERLQAYNSKLLWADTSCSDCIAFYNAYRVWRVNKSTGLFDRSKGKGEEGWARQYHIQLNSLREVARLQDELLRRLKRFKIEPIRGNIQPSVNWNEFEKPLVLKMVMAGAFYPSYFVRGGQHGQEKEAEAVRMLGGKDPCTTVYLSNMPLNQPGQLYAKNIREYFKDCSETMKFTFDNSKIYVSFVTPPMYCSLREPDSKRGKPDLKALIPGSVSMAVYRAIKMRQLNVMLRLHILPPKLAAERAMKLGLDTKQEMIWDSPQSSLSQKVNSSLPSVDTTFINIQITHMADAGHFWAQRCEMCDRERLSWIFSALNKEGNLVPLGSDERVLVGHMYACVFVDSERSYYRARVQKLTKDSIQVYFVDYGNTQPVCKRDLMKFSTQLINDNILDEPDLAIECVLASIQPSIVKNPQGIWSDVVDKWFKQKWMDRELSAKVYSVVNGVVSLELYCYKIEVERSAANYETVNAWLIKNGYAQSAEESYLSKSNHDKREQYRELKPAEKNAHDFQQMSDLGDWKNQLDVEPPRREECGDSIILRGPNSPLEMKLYSVVQSSLSQNVHIEWNSVNSVLLDTDPQDPHERLLVAAMVTQNTSGDALTLRNTTLMPNLHGLPALTCMMFAPNVELRADETFTKIVGAICGLGYDAETRQPLFHENDIEVTFDTEFTIDDVVDLDCLRYYMNLQLCEVYPYDPHDFSTNQTVKVQSNIKKYFLSLMHRKRKSSVVVLNSRAFEWDLLPEERKLVLLSGDKTPCTQDVIYKIIEGVDLESHPVDSTQYLRNLKELEEVASGLKPTQEMVCNLCQMRMQNSQQVRIHLITAQHQERLTSLNLGHEKATHQQP